ncbi:MAG TPA: lysophospholipid acyltransferase family protein [Chthoniobacteraceae bacterium]|jgi:1-acyl-sn-glycerol-3-phosphate acyltransferase|nr:lysophospholipid acyltransferase family protein [Chthoniobacteraceae bacterium]
MAHAGEEMRGWYRLGYKLSWLLARLLFRFEVIGRDKIPRAGGCILAMNHESYLDPPLAGICCRRAIHFLARKTLLEWPLLGPIFPKVNVVPVDQERADMSALKTVIKLVRIGECTIVFPEGARTADGNLQPVQPGLGLVIAKTLAPVVPMRIFGAHNAFPAGGKHFRLCKIRIVVGDPMTFTEQDLEGKGRDLYQHLSERVMERIAAIQLPA